MIDLLAQATGQGSGRSFWMPEQAATTARGVDDTFSFIFYVSLFFFALIVVLMFAFVARYRRKRPDQAAISQVSHSTTLEVTWTIIPVILVVVMFWMGFRSFLDMRTMPGDAYEIEVRAYKWAWEFAYPGEDGITSGELHVPIDTPVRLVMQSDDVIHSLFIPAFRVKRDVVPGRYSDLWFKATQAGTYPLLCTEYCGTSHSDMVTTVTVHGPGEFQKWLENANPIKKMSDEQIALYLEDYDAFMEQYGSDPVLGALQPPVGYGESVVTAKGCLQCHSIDGAAMQGPTFKGLFDREHIFADGTKVTDYPEQYPNVETYVRESILQPNARIVQGYGAVMPRIRLDDREISLIIRYLKTLSESTKTE